MFTILGADGKEYGPVSMEKLQRWLIEGRANLQTKARRDGETEWRPLGDFAEFASPGTGIPPPMSPPMSAAGAQAELELAGRWERLGAQVVDGVIACVVALPGLGLVLAAGGFKQDTDRSNPALLYSGIGLLCLMFLALVAVQIYLLSAHGQTLGKKLLGVKIVNFADEANPGFVKAFLLRAFVNGVIGAIPLIGGAYSLVDICFIFRDDRRCLHDLIAGTKVVKA